MTPELTQWILGLFVAAICALWIRLESVNRRSQRKHDECEQDRQKLTNKQERLTRIVVSARFCRARECVIREMAEELDTDDALRGIWPGVVFSPSPTIRKLVQAAHLWCKLHPLITPVQPPTV